MDASDINRLLSTDHYAPADLDRVERICRTYPHFGLAHILKARILEALGYENEKEVKLAAIYASDRARLRELVAGWKEKAAEEANNEQEDQEERIQFGEDPTGEAEVIIEQHAPYAGHEQDEDLPGQDDDLLELDRDEEPESFILESEEGGNRLIQDFISEEPGPIRADIETRLKGDVSVNSIREHDGFITDTLAQIYVKQRLYTKAIYAYEKLSLKYPEKSAYFAAQIEKISNINH